MNRFSLKLVAGLLAALIVGGLVATTPNALAAGKGTRQQYEGEGKGTDEKGKSSSVYYSLEFWSQPMPKKPGSSDLYYGQWTGGYIQNFHQTGQGGFRFESEGYGFKHVVRGSIGAGNTIHIEDDQFWAKDGHFAGHVSADLRWVGNTRN